MVLMRDYVNAPLLLGYFCVLRAFSVIARGLQIPDSQNLYSVLPAGRLTRVLVRGCGTSTNMNVECRGQRSTAGCRAAECRQPQKGREEQTMTLRLRALLQKVSAPIKLQRLLQFLKSYGGSDSKHVIQGPVHGSCLRGTRWQSCTGMGSTVSACVGLARGEAPGC